MQTHLERTRDRFSISTDARRTDIAAVHAYLSRSYWAEGIPIDIVARSIEDSMCFNLFDSDQQIGFARVVTDRCTYAYLCDVYVLETYQGKGLGTWLMETVCSHPDLQMVRRFSLVTRDAHWLYKKFGFTPLADPTRHMEMRRPEIYKTLSATEPTVQPSAGLSFVRAGYDRWSAVYDHDRNPLPALEEPHVRQTAGDVRGLDVLDLGCGTGRHALWLADAGAHVTAVDFSDGMLAKAREKAGTKDIRFVVHDLHDALPFDDGAFDLVISGLVLEHIRDLDTFFQQSRRVIRRGGRAIVSNMHPVMFLLGSKARFTDPDSGQIVPPGSLSHTFSDMMMSALSAGFAIDSIKEYAPDAAFAAEYPRARKYLGWPMLIVMGLRS